MESLPRIKKIVGDIPILGISGHPKYLRIFKMLGASKVIEKPFKIETLIGAINETVLHQSRLSD